MDEFIVVEKTILSKIFGSKRRMAPVKVTNHLFSNENLKIAHLNALKYVKHQLEIFELNEREIKKGDKIQLQLIILSPLDQEELGGIALNTNNFLLLDFDGNLRHTSKFSSFVEMLGLVIQEFEERNKDLEPSVKKTDVI